MAAALLGTLRVCTCSSPTGSVTVCLVRTGPLTSSGYNFCTGLLRYIGLPFFVSTFTFAPLIYPSFPVINIILRPFLVSTFHATLLPLQQSPCLQFQQLHHPLSHFSCDVLSVLTNTPFSISSKNGLA